MRISKYSGKNFEIKTDDDERTKMLKRYYFHHDMFDRELENQIENKTLIEELEQRIAMEELLKS